MSITGKNTLSIRKRDVAEQKSIAVGFKKTQLAHQATLGETGIDLTALSVPSDMSSLGFTNPSTSDILAAKLFFYRKNFTLWSSAKGTLAQDLSYTINANDRIVFRGWTADADEIFIGTLDHNPKTQLQVVDASPVIATGVLAATDTDFNVGTPFEVNKYDTAQVGAVTVFLDGLQQFRNTDNQAAPADGNYYEVDPGGGAGVLIRFNTAHPTNDRSVLVMSTGLLAEKPTASMIAEVERVQGQIDAMVPDLAILASVPETNYQAAPNNIDLKQFGDRLLALEDQFHGTAPLGSIVPIYTSGLTGAFTVPATGVVDADTGLMRADGAVIPGGNLVSGTTPDLSDSRFLMGSTSSGTSGGNNSSAHTHTSTLGLTHLPAHTHGVTDPGHTHPPTDANFLVNASSGGNYTGGALPAAGRTTTGTGFTNISITSSGGGNPVTSSGASSTENRPLFMSVIFCIRVN